MTAASPCAIIVILYIEDVDLNTALPEGSTTSDVILYIEDVDLNMGKARGCTGK